MFGLFTLYGFCLISGVFVERRFSADSLLERILIVFSVGSAQLIFSVQILSLQYWLSGWGLLIVNGLFLALVYSVLGRWKVPVSQKSWKTLIKSAWKECNALRTDRMLMIAGVSSAIFIFMYWVIGYSVIPVGDGYHYDMPIFWRQHHSILPFAIPNPRGIAVTFASEALCFPGYLFCNSDKIVTVLTLVSALLSINIIYSIARRLNCSFAAAISSAMIAAGYTTFALSFWTMSADIFLAMMWSGASMLFLLNACPSCESQNSMRNLGWSVFCFALACGTKNTCILTAPFLIICIAFVLRHSSLEKKSWSHLIIIGVIALTCSGVVWNYTSNMLWFGNFKGPPFMQNHTSSDFKPRSVWTRLTRGMVMFMFDTTVVPNTQQINYSSWCANSLKLLGAHERLSEDDNYFGLKKTDLKPRSGFGLLGILAFFPGVVLGFIRCFRIRFQTETGDVSGRLKTGLLVLMTVASFVIPHIMLKSQPIGLVRIIPVFLMAGAPLVATLMEKLAFRIAGLALLALSGIMFLTFYIGASARLLEFYSDNSIIKKIVQLQNKPKQIVEYTWTDHTPQIFLMEENNFIKALCLTFLSGIDQPAKIGFIGTENSVLYYLFGKNFSNVIIPLNDSRNYDQIQEPVKDMEYVVIIETRAGSNLGPFNSSKIDTWCLMHNFKTIFRATRGGKSYFTALKKDINSTSMSVVKSAQAVM